MGDQEINRTMNLLDQRTMKLEDKIIGSLSRSEEYPMVRYKYFFYL